MKKSCKKRDLPESEKQILVGTFRLCDVNVDLYGWQSYSSGHFFTAPDDTSRPRIKVGLDCDWGRCVGLLLHEAMEFAAVFNRVRYTASPDASADNGLYHFCMTHTQFAEVVAEAGWFLASALPALSKVYNREHRKR